MDVDNLSPPNRDLLMEATSAGELVNELYRDGERLDAGFSRERRCFALGERGWLAFAGWDGAPAGGAWCQSRWTLTDAALAALSRRLLA